MAQNFIDPDTFVDPDNIPNPEPSTTPPAPSSILRKGFEDAVRKYAPLLPTVGAIYGGTVAIPPAIVSGPMAPVTEAAGIGTGYIGGKWAQNALEQVAGIKQPGPTGNAFVQGLDTTKEAVETGVAGPIAGKVLQKGLKMGGNIIKDLIARWGGAGKAAVDEAVLAGKTLEGPNVLRTQTSFDKALRGETTDMEPVTIAQKVLRKLRKTMGDEYSQRLTDLGKPTVTPGTPGTPGVPGTSTRVTPAAGRKFINTQSIEAEVQDAIKEAGIQVARDGSLDFSRTGLGEAANKRLSETINMVRSWGNQMPKIQQLKANIRGWGNEISKSTDPKVTADLKLKINNASDEVKDLYKQYSYDRSALGLDKLKKTLSDFWSESSKAKAFVARIEKRVADTITSAVPEYGIMNRDYKTKIDLIQDIERVLSMKGPKPGDLGQADKILAKMNSVMRKDTNLSRQLLDVLSREGVRMGQEDIKQLLAGKLLSGTLPKSQLLLASEVGGGAALTHFKGAKTLFKPEFLTVILSSSPRVQGEFLRLVGKTLQMTQGMTKPVGTMIVADKYGGRDPSKMSDQELKDLIESAMGLRKRLDEAVTPSTPERLRLEETKKRMLLNRDKEKDKVQE